MPPKTPEFWYRSADTKPTCREKILYPAAAAYQIGHRANLALTKTQAANIPVICIGNLTAGGSGKTPICLAIHKIIQQQQLFHSPFFLTRGYGGTATQPKRIEDHDDASTVGDEPLILSSHCNTIISKNRHSGACYADELGADCVIMDDGLQNLSLKKDLTFLVINGEMGFGNNKTIPAGPLREPLQNALTRTDAIILIGEDKRNTLRPIEGKKPVFKCDIAIPENKAPDKDKEYVAFCGLGYPDKFFNTLQTQGYKILSSHPYPDHHLYNEADLAFLTGLAKESNTQLITTEKDYVKIPKPYRSMVSMLPIEIVWKDESAITAFLKNTLSKS